MTQTTLILLLKFLKIFLTVLSQIAQLVKLAEQFPHSVYQMETLLGSHEEIFIRYVVCSKCYSVYKYDNCITVVGTTKVALQCKQRNSNYVQPCNGKLLKQVELLDHKVIFYPMKVYCYMPLHYYFHTLLNRPGCVINAWARCGKDHSPDYSTISYLHFIESMCKMYAKFTLTLHMQGRRNGPIIIYHLLFCMESSSSSFTSCSIFRRRSQSELI